MYLFSFSLNMKKPVKCQYTCTNILLTYKICFEFSVVCHVIAATYQTIPSDLLKELLGDIPGTNTHAYSLHQMAMILDTYIV